MSSEGPQSNMRMLYKPSNSNVLYSPDSSTGSSASITGSSENHTLPDESFYANIKIIYKSSNSDVLYSPDPITGSSGISLDGQSLVLPDESDYADTKMPVTDDYGDEVSSFNTSLRGDQEIEEIKMVGMRPTSDDSLTDHSSPSASEDLEIIQDHKSTSCLPLWIRGAPYWLRSIFIGSLALFIGAAVLVGLGVGLSKRESSSAVVSQNNPTTEFWWDPTMDTSTSGPTTDFLGDPTMDTSTSGPFEMSESMPETPPILPRTKVPTVAPTGVPSREPSDFPVSQTEVPTVAPTGIPSREPSAFPVSQTKDPTGVPSREPSAFPVLQTNPLTETQDLEVFTFYVTGGRYSDDERAVVPDRLENLPNNMGTSFLLHIGDWNSPSGGCEEQSYQDANTLFRTSSVPVYFLPGDNEYNGTLNKPQ
jgi:hypothetical protein